MRRARIRDEGPVSFLSRMRGRAGVEPLPEERFRREVGVVIRNLESILNTRKGVGTVVADLGLGDYEGKLASDGTSQPLIGTKETLAVLVPELAEQVRKFEPRIEDPTVVVLGRDGTTHAVFGLRGKVSGKTIDFRITLHTTYRDVKVEAQGDGLD